GFLEKQLSPGLAPQCRGRGFFLCQDVPRTRPPTVEAIAPSSSAICSRRHAILRAGRIANPTRSCCGPPPARRIGERRVGARRRTQRSPMPLMATIDPGHFATNVVYFYMSNGDQRVRCGISVLVLESLEPELPHTKQGRLQAFQWHRT